MPELHRWQIVSNGRHRYALGYVYGDPSLEDGTHIRTARILAEVVTYSVQTVGGKSYRLVDPA